MEFLRLPLAERVIELENAKQYLSDGMITEVSETCYGTKEIYKIE